MIQRSKCRWLPTSLLLFASAVPSTGHTQAVLGEVVDRASAASLPGVFVELVDGAGKRVDSSLTDEVGAFRLQVPEPGTYTLRAAGIGFGTVASPPLNLESEDLSYHFEIAPHAARLGSLPADPDAQGCTVRPKEGSPIHTAWDQARVALDVAMWVERSGHVEGEMLSYERTIDPLDDSTLREALRWRTALDGAVSSMAHADEIVQQGFVQQRLDGYRFFRLDPEILLSDAFLDTHCLRLRPGGRNQRGLLGIAFEPARGRTVPGVRGVLWLDGATAELRSLEYTFTWLPWLLPADPFGGEAEFRRLSGGAWLVERWAFRAPRVDREPPEIRYYRRPTPREILARLRHDFGLVIVESGGEVARWLDPGAPREP